MSLRPRGSMDVANDAWRSASQRRRGIASSKLKAKLESMMSKFETRTNSERWQCHLTPDEEKLLVGIVEQWDLHGFGLDRR